MNMPNKRRGRKPLNLPEKDRRHPCTIRASVVEYEVIKAFVKLLRNDMERCREFVGFSQAPTSALPSAVSTPAPINVIQKFTNDTMDLTDEQQVVFNALKSGKNVFLSGGAGTGKSYVLKKFIEYAESKGKNVLRMAPTGIAARNIDGSTIHRTFQLPTTIIGPDDFQEDNYPRQIGQKSYEVLSHADIIIIDEISMCRSDYFSFVAKFILAEDKLHLPFRFDVKEEDPQSNKKPKRIRHHIQVILCGDFAQLSPIISKTDKEVWNKCYTQNDSGWPFLTSQWEALQLMEFDLKNVIRQSDPFLVEALNQIRCGNPAGIEYINKNCAKTRQANCMTLCTTNQQVDQINRSHYSRLTAQDERTYELKQEGEVTADDKRNIPFRLRLKSGTRVLFLANDKDVNPPRYSNGSFGTVTATSPDFVMVRLDNGPVIKVTPYVWQVSRPVLVKEKGKKRVKQNIVGKFSQLPLTFGWAITVHKSQGQTFEAMNVNPARIFADGQLYVALSRCKDVHKMYLSQKLRPADVKTSGAVKHFYRWDNEENAPKE